MTELETQIQTITTSLEQFAVSNEAVLSDTQLIAIHDSIRSMDRIWLEFLNNRDDDDIEDDDSLILYDFPHNQLSSILKTRMKAYQTRTGNTDNGGFPFYTFKIR